MFLLYYNVSVVSGFSKAGGLLSVDDAGSGFLIAPHMFFPSNQFCSDIIT